ncbi:MAG: hypothetical protein AAFS04_02255 [Cyanobacteria bacterium J06631_9]
MTKRYLIEVYDAPKDELERLATEESLSVKFPDTFGERWCFWTHAIPRVGEYLMFPGWFLIVEAVYHPIYVDSSERTVADERVADAHVAVTFHRNYKKGTYQAPGFKDGDPFEEK